MGKEKIWIEKLIELLNEYNEIHNYAPIEYYDDEANGFETNYVAFYKTCIIISKQFWFIKWLVENDKIDISKIKCWYIYNDTEEDKVKNVIMNLSISDTPIEDLISYLK